MDIDKFSLSVIIPTCGRRKELLILLNTLSQSEIKPLEVIIVDQNHPSFLGDILWDTAYDLNIRRFNVDFKGASKARNLGILNAQGDYLCFPDDDCEIFPDTFTKSFTFLEKYDVVFGKCIDRNGADSVIKFDTTDGELNIANMDGRFVEATIFVRKELIKKYLFDENLGVGTFHGAEEAYDLVYRLLKDGVSIYFSNLILFYHPNKVISYADSKEIRRVFSYRCGMASLCMKHHLYRRYYLRLFSVLIYIPFLALFHRNKLRYYLSELSGLISGTIVK